MSAYLLQMNGILNLTGWQWMFLIQGLPAALIGIVVLIYLRDTPQQAHWLSDDERRELIAMLEEEPRDKPRKAVWAALTDGRVLLLAAIQFGFVLGSYGIGIWLPLILKGRGFSTVEVGFLSTIPYIGAIFGMLLWARVVDRSGRKIGNLLLACLLGAIGLFHPDQFLCTGNDRHQYRRDCHQFSACHLLDHTDRLPDRGGRCWRTGFHQLNRHYGRLRWSVHGGSAQGSDRLVQLRHLGYGRHSCTVCHTQFDALAAGKKSNSPSDFTELKMNHVTNMTLACDSHVHVFDPARFPTHCRAATLPRQPASGSSGSTCTSWAWHGSC
jgi:hypothetical protein